MVSTKPMNFEEASFIGHENQFMAFSWHEIIHGFFMGHDLFHIRQFSPLVHGLLKTLKT